MRYTRLALAVLLTAASAALLAFAPNRSHGAGFAITEEARKHWSFQPLRGVTPPAVKNTAWAKTDVDRFLLAKIEERGLTPVVPADRLSLLRRATFDLTGLPPRPEEVDAFLSDDSPDAFARLVDRLLASPHYGERWGRHWLDLVRYADTAGETADYPTPLAWRYRNYVIDAFNADKPYDLFVKEQLAGDLLARQLPHDAPEAEFRQKLTATGYLAISRRFGAKIERDHYLTIEDTIDTVGKSLLGLTVACARCHDHKYDPVSAADYYALYGIFDSTRYPYPGCELVKRPKYNVPLVTPAQYEREVRPRHEELLRLNAKFERARDELTTMAQAWAQSRREQRRDEIARGEFLNNGKQGLTDGEPRELTVAAGDVIRLTVLPKADNKFDFTVVDLRITELDGAKREWATGPDLNPDLLAANPHPDSRGEPAVWWMAAGAADAPALFATAIKGTDDRAGLHVWGSRKAPLAMANTTDTYIVVNNVAIQPKWFVVQPPADGVVTVEWMSPVSGEVQVGGRLSDGDAQGGDGVAWVLEHVRFDPAAGPLDPRVASAARACAEAKRLRDAEEAAQPTLDMAYAVSEGSPREAAIQVRGERDKLGAVVPRRNLEILGGQIVPEGAGSGRLQLAEWIASPDNPLTARVMVNRVWQHHFGQGIVKTPSDFGTRGTPPTHPELLDWLTRQFIDGGWSVKKLHRQIMLTAAYQLSSAEDPAALQADPGNTLRWRFDRRRLSAEEIRDSLLAVSGDLDATPGGPHPFPAEKKWGYTQHEPFVALYETNRRSVYLMVQRIKRHPFLALFDGADANASTAERIDTTVPTQALFFMNDPFVFARSESFAGRLMALPDDAARLDRAYRLCFGRVPTEAEAEQAMAFVNDYAADLTDVPADRRPEAAWAAYARVLFGSNEMLYVD